MAVFLDVTFYDEAGAVTGHGVPMYLPDFLDRRDIRAKGFWFLERGEGPPTAKYALINSQGQQRLLIIEKPLQHHRHTELKEKEHGLEDRVLEYVTREGIGYGPLNQ